MLYPANNNRATLNVQANKQHFQTDVHTFIVINPQNEFTQYVILLIECAYGPSATHRISWCQALFINRTNLLAHSTFN